MDMIPREGITGPLLGTLVRILILLHGLQVGEVAIRGTSFPAGGARILIKLSQFPFLCTLVIFLHCHIVDSIDGFNIYVLAVLSTSRTYESDI